MEKLERVLKDLGFHVSMPGDVLYIKDVRKAVFNPKTCITMKKILLFSGKMGYTKWIFLISCLVILGMVLYPKKREFIENSTEIRKVVKGQDFSRFSCDMKDQGINQEIKQKTPQGLIHANNSCYMDSVLVSLFFFDNKGIERSISGKDRLSRKLTHIRDFIRGTEQGNISEKDVESLRKIINHPQFSGNGMQDAGEFLGFLLDKLGMTIKVEEHKVSYMRGKACEDTTSIKQVSPLFLIESDQLLTKKAVVLSSVHTSLITLENPVINDRKIRYDSFRTTTNILSGDCVIFYTPRNMGFGRSYTNVNYPEEIMLKYGKNLYLQAVVVHSGRHYTAYLKDGGSLFFYDDLTGVTPLREFPDHLGVEGVLYFYG